MMVKNIMGKKTGRGAAVCIDKFFDLLKFPVFVVALRDQIVISGLPSGLV
ncbi:hypothetical protein IV417_03530 [Alphaproteobacteria bacterium KMM 3653]|uniref:Uncharacterized protein n=1 Tax=Harenicola maris TaxID=2841044 RepID=A0AAP2CMS4_9RHOB|nr:hypothetical protein [Harenicola maris]